MDKEVVRLLCNWMATRCDIPLDKLRTRIGKNQTTRYGSAGFYNDTYSVSVSTYPTRTKNKSSDTTNKIRILETIVHEFAHLELHRANDYMSKHNEVFKDKLNELLARDWEELVKCYNILAGDDLTSEISFVQYYADDPWFDSQRYNRAKRVIYEQ